MGYGLAAPPGSSTVQTLRQQQKARSTRSDDRGSVMMSVKMFKLAGRFVLLLVCVSRPVTATDLSGTYYAVSPVESSAGSAEPTAAVLTIKQTGSLLNGTLRASAWWIEFSGASDGSNMANVGVTLKHGSHTSGGFMILRRHRDGIQASVVIRGNREISGQYHFTKSEP